MKHNVINEFPSFGMGGRRRPKRVAVVLVGGDGSRLKPLTRAIAGDERPKQFCPILNDRTLLDETRRRIRNTFAADAGCAVGSIRRLDALRMDPVSARAV